MPLHVTGSSAGHTRRGDWCGFSSSAHANGVVIEIGRKTRAPADEEPNVETYSALWGAGTAVSMWLGALMITAGFALQAASLIDAAAPILALLIALLVICATTAICFLRRQEPRSGRTLETAAGVWTLCIYLESGHRPFGRSTSGHRSAMAMILRAGDVSPDAPVGGKARALASAQAAGMPVPDWFVVTSEALQEQASPSTAEPLTISPALSLAIRDALEAWSHKTLAVRSSASDEDGATCSLAGQLESLLDVRRGEVPEAVARVWRSGFSARVIAYRRQTSTPTAAPTGVWQESGMRGPAVIVQRMVQADASGVAFSADPMSGQRGVAVVSGRPWPRRVPRIGLDRRRQLARRSGLCRHPPPTRG